MEEVKLDSEEEGRLQPGGPEVHWLLPIVMGLGVMAVSVFGAWQFWHWVVSK